MLELIKKNKGIMVICVLYGIISFFLFGLLTRWIVTIHGDSPDYIALATNLSVNGFFSMDGINADYLRTPGYPLFVALIYMLGGNNTTVAIVQILLMMIKVFLFYRILILLDTPKRISLMGSILFLFYIHSYRYSFEILTEPLFGFFLMLSLYFLVSFFRSSKSLLVFFLFSLSLNYALFIRPVLMYFNMLICFVLLIAFIVKKIQFKYFAIFTLWFVVLFGGWSYRNYLHSGVFIFSTLPKAMLQQYEVPIITEYVKSNDVTSLIMSATNFHEEMFLQEYPEVKDGNLNAAQIAILQGKYGSQFIRDNFSEYIKVNIIGFLKIMFSPFGTEYFLSSSTLSTKTMFVKVVQCLYFVYIIIIYVIYLIGLGIGLKKRDILQISIFLLSCYFVLPSAIYGSVRYRDQFFFLLLLCAISNSGIIIHWLSQKLRIPVLQRIENYLLHE